MPSGKPREYKQNPNRPEKDIKQISPSEASFISMHWLNNILVPKIICQEDEYIIQNINKLEQFIQDKYTQHQEPNPEFLIWKPRGYKSDILFLIVLEPDIEQNKYFLKILINSPFWDHSQINTFYLLDSLNKYLHKKGKILDIEPFLNENIRYNLIWKDINLDL
jgi:hypothetical protein